MIKKYTNGNSMVLFNTCNGTKERVTLDNEFKPSFAESIDCTITYKCDGGCEYCYAGCSLTGRHANLLSDYVLKTFIPSLEPYTELALNGNDLSHPQLVSFLEYLKQFKIYANISVSQTHFMRNISLIQKLSQQGLIHGIGVSYLCYDETFIHTLSCFPNAIVHVIAGVVSPEEVLRLSANGVKLLILGYKRKGRGSNWYLDNQENVQSNLKGLSGVLPELFRRKEARVLSFDNLALSQLGIHNLLSVDEWNVLYMGDDGKFTYFVDLVNRKFARNSLTDKTYNIGNYDAIEMFRIIQKEMYYN